MISDDVILYLRPTHTLPHTSIHSEQSRHVVSSWGQATSHVVGPHIHINEFLIITDCVSPACPLSLGDQTTAHVVDGLLDQRFPIRGGQAVPAHPARACSALATPGAPARRSFGRSSSRWLHGCTADAASGDMLQACLIDLRRLTEASALGDQAAHEHCILLSPYEGFQFRGVPETAGQIRWTIVVRWVGTRTRRRAQCQSGWPRPRCPRHPGAHCRHRRRPRSTPDASQ
jgi:hypothetical protein